MIDRSTPTPGKPYAKCLILFLFASIAINLQAQDRGLQVVAKEVSGADITIGKQYVVLIAVDKYQEWNSLRNPVKDAKAVKDILQKRYYVDEVIELYNEAATSSGIRKLFGTLTEKVRPTDSVLIYYAGHGYLDKFQTGFWIPVDGGRDVDEQNKWIANAQIRNFVTQMKARSVALVADSCFSGDLLNVSRGATPTIDSAYYKAALKYTARQVLTSGASEAVPDESEFARQFRAVLENNTETCLDPIAMYDRIRRGVTSTLPLLGTLPGHETGGSFVLFLKETKPVVQAPNVQAPPVVEVKKVQPTTSQNALDEQIRITQGQIDTLKIALAEAQTKKQSKKSIGTVSLITGGVSGIAAGALYFLGASAMDAYNTATSIEDAKSKRAILDLYSGLFIGTASLSGAGLGLGAIMFGTLPNPQQIEEQVQSRIEDLHKLEAKKLLGN